MIICRSLLILGINRLNVFMKRAHNLVDINGLMAVPKLVGIAKRLGTHGVQKEDDKDLKSIENNELLRVELLEPLTVGQIELIRKYTADRGNALLAKIVKKLGKSFGVFPPYFGMSLEVSDRETAMTMQPGFYDLERPYDSATFLQFSLQTGGQLVVDREAMGGEPDIKIEELMVDLNKRIHEIRSSKWPGVFASYPVKGKRVPIIFVPDMEHTEEPAEEGAEAEAKLPEEKPPYLYATFRSLETAHTVVNLLEPLVPVSGIRNLARKAVAGVGKKGGINRR